MGNAAGTVLRLVKILHCGGKLMLHHEFYRFRGAVRQIGSLTEGFLASRQVFLCNWQICLLDSRFQLIGQSRIACHLL